MKKQHSAEEKTELKTASIKKACETLDHVDAMKTFLLQIGSETRKQNFGNFMSIFNQTEREFKKPTGQKYEFREILRNTEVTFKTDWGSKIVSAEIFLLEAICKNMGNLDTEGQVSMIFFLQEAKFNLDRRYNHTGSQEGISYLSTEQKKAKLLNSPSLFATALVKEYKSLHVILDFMPKITDFTLLSLVCNPNAFICLGAMGIEMIKDQIKNPYRNVDTEFDANLKGKEYRKEYHRALKEALEELSIPNVIFHRVFLGYLGRSLGIESVSDDDIATLLSYKKSKPPVCSLNMNSFIATASAAELTSSPSDPGNWCPIL